MKQKLIAVASAAMIGLTAVAIPSKVERWPSSWSSDRFKALLLWSGILRLRVRSLLLRLWSVLLWWRSLLLRATLQVLPPALQTLDGVLVGVRHLRGASSRGGPMA